MTIISIWKINIALLKMRFHLSGIGVPGKSSLLVRAEGGVASLKVATRYSDNRCIVGVVALSAPIEYEGTTFYSNDELRSIKIPKLIINSEFDGGANDTRKMSEILSNPKEVLFYAGDAHGTELFSNEGEAFVTKLKHFIASVFEN
ncbi:MAG: hypothetical protein JEZ12_04235 [Desulfobacterium sp.]|nr:hypothetical protein [Desulfobacterium sp.]